MSQWLRLHAPSAGGMGSIPGQETKVLHAMHAAKKKKKIVMVAYLILLPLLYK